MKITVTLPGYMGKPHEVEGDVESGLIVHKLGKSWCISHVASGCRIGPGDKTVKDAKARRARLLALLPDWSAESVEALAVAAGRSTRDFADAVRAAAY